MKFLYYILCIGVLLISACENKSSDAVAGMPIGDSAKAASKTIVKESPVNNEADSIPMEKTACLAPDKISKNYKGDGAEVSIDIESVCTGDYSILDTLEDYEGNLKINAHSSYEHKLTFSLKGKAKHETISRNLFADSIRRHRFDNYVLVKPQIIDYNVADTSVSIQFLFGPPDTDDVIYANFKVFYNAGATFTGFSVPDYE